MPTATLHLLCGPIAAGKSTLAKTLAEQPNCVLISEDDWLSALYSDQMNEIADYLRCAGRLRRIIAPHVASLLSAGVSVVLDFPANTVETRQWMAKLITDTQIPHQLHFLDVDLTLCRARMHQRNASGQHPFQVSDAQFDRISRHFQPPTTAEGFVIVYHQGTAG